MDTDGKEADKLRKQIQFLESLISTATVQKTKESRPNWKATTNKTFKPSRNPKFHSQPFRQESGSVHNARNFTTKYTWNRNRNESKHESFINRDKARENSFPYSRPGLDISDPFMNRQTKNDRQGEVSLPYFTSQTATKVSGNLSSLDLTHKAHWQDRKKLKSSFIWKRSSETDKNLDSLQTKKTQSCERLDKNIKLKSLKSPAQDTSETVNSKIKEHESKLCENAQTNNVNGGLKPPSARIMHHPDTVSSGKTASHIPSSVKSKHSDDNNINTVKKHISLQNEILKTQNRLAELKKTLLERKSSQISVVPEKNRNKTISSSPNFSKSIHSRPKSFKSYPSFHKRHQQQSYNYQYRNPVKPWTGRYTDKSWSDRFSDSRWNRKHQYGKPYLTFVRTGMYSLRGRRGKNRTGYKSSYTYNSYGYSGRRHVKHFPYFSKKVLHHRYGYGKHHSISKEYVRRRVERINTLKEKVPFNPKMKLDRRKQGESNGKGLKFVVINGMLYKTSKKSLVRAPEKQCVPNTSTKRQVSSDGSGGHSRIKFLKTTAMKTVTVRGVKFKVDRDGKSLKRMDRCQTGPSNNQQTKGTSSISRVDIGGVTYRQTKPGTLEKVNTRKTRVIAKRVLNKSVAQVASKYMKDNRKSTKQQQFCMFYNRFGKCNRQDKCPFIHDPDRIAVCSRFLRGTCKVKTCPFSHKVSAEKMPVCSYFLKGICNKSDCPYLHVNVNKNAEICQDFVNGFCVLGKTCKKKHTLLCPVFVKTGSCSDGKKCRLQHRKPKRRKSSGTSASTSIAQERTHSSVLKSDLEPVSSKDTGSDIPSTERRLPAYISLNIKGTDKSIAVNTEQGSSQSQTQDETSMKIRPQL